jgi:hypothetical protein
MSLRVPKPPGLNGKPNDWWKSARTGGCVHPVHFYRGDHPAHEQLTLKPGTTTLDGSTSRCCFQAAGKANALRTLAY